MSDNIEIKVVAEGAEGMNKRELSAVVDNELNRFSHWLVATFNGTSPLLGIERAMLKTYLMAKLEGHGQVKEGDPTPES